MRGRRWRIMLWWRRIWWKPPPGAWFSRGYEGREQEVKGGYGPAKWRGVRVLLYKGEFKKLKFATTNGSNLWWPNTGLLGLWWTWPKSKSYYKLKELSDEPKLRFFGDHLQKLKFFRNYEYVGFRDLEWTWIVRESCWAQRDLTFESITVIFLKFSKHPWFFQNPN